MAINFSQVKKIVLPEGEAKALSIDGVQVWSASRLPSAYQEVEYVHNISDKVGIIDTTTYLEMYPESRLELFFSLPSNVKPDKYIIGVAPAKGRCNVDYSSGKIAVLVNSSTGSAVTLGSFSCSVENKHQLSIWRDSNNKIHSKLDSGAESSTRTLYLQNGNLLLNGLNTSTMYNCYAKYYEYKFYGNGVMVRDLIPCYRKSDGKIGMYDIIEKVFHASTGTWSKGGDV